MQQPNENSNEFEWEQALRESDEYAQKYFELLQRFCDLPDSERLIAKRMGPDYAERMGEHMFEDEVGPWEDMLDVEEPGWGLALPSFESKADDDEENDEEAAQALFYETNPTFGSLRQAATGWCNVYSAILPSEKRALGLQALYHMGRALANLAYSLEEGANGIQAASLALAKRSLASLNMAVGLVQQIGREQPEIASLVGTIGTHLIRCTDGVVDHISTCREKLHRK